MKLVPGTPAVTFRTENLKKERCTHPAPLCCTNPLTIGNVPTIALQRHFIAEICVTTIEG